MRVIVAIILIVSVNYLRAQKEITSFYFSEAQPMGLSPVEKLDASICGTYLFEEDTLTSVIIEPDSIYTKYSVFTFITRKELKKSEKFTVANDLLFGVVKGLGLPYIERNDTLFTVFIQTETFFKPSQNKLMKSEDNYFLNFKQANGLYSTQVLTKTNTGIVFYSLDHEVVLDRVLSFENTETKELDGFKTYVSSPTKSEFLLFVKNKGFTDKYAYATPDVLRSH